MSFLVPFLPLILSAFSSAASAAPKAPDLGALQCASDSQSDTRNFTELSGTGECPRTEALVDSVMDRLLRNEPSLEALVRGHGGITQKIYCNVDSDGMYLQLGQGYQREGARMILFGQSIARLKSEDALAFLMAHELAHYLKCEHGSTIRGEKNADAIALKIVSDAGYNPLAALTLFAQQRHQWSGQFRHIPGIRDAIGGFIERYFVDREDRDHPTSFQRTTAAMRQIISNRYPHEFSVSRASLKGVREELSSQ